MPPEHRPPRPLAEQAEEDDHHGQLGGARRHPEQLGRLRRADCGPSGGPFVRV
jgi:hypothetical protein